jgi:predicted KAP-like P-loop ATPase
LPEVNLAPFGDDSPKSNPWQEDKLGYAPFAKRLAKLIASLDAPNGYVIGLHGQWGSGKSTALNFIRAYLEKQNQEAEGAARKVEMIDFRPWIVSGHQDLVSAFFKVLSEHLGPQDGWWSRKSKAVVKITRDVPDKLVDSIATVAVTIDPTAGVASAAAGTIAKKSLSGLIDKFLASPSLQKAYDELKKQLAASGRRFLITIDDLDRLESHEVKDIMRMVKTVGQLPNVIYLLAYDRSIVWKALGDSLDHVGPKFAEKIVQQEVELPMPSKNALLNVLEAD